MGAAWLGVSLMFAWLFGGCHLQSLVSHCECGHFFPDARGWVKWWPGLAETGCAKSPSNAGDNINDVTSQVRSYQKKLRTRYTYGIDEQKHKSIRRNLSAWSRHPPCD